MMESGRRSACRFLAGCACSREGSDDRSLDLFRGQSATYLLDHKSIMPDLQQEAHGVIRRVPGDRITVLWYGEPGDRVAWQYTPLP